MQPVPTMTPRAASALAFDLKRSGATSTQWIARIEEARELMTGDERQKFEALYRREYDHMRSDGLAHFGPGALAGTLWKVSQVIGRK